MNESRVYFVQCGEDGPVKIGISRKNAHARRRELQAGNPVPLRLLGTTAGGREREKLLHNRFAPFHIAGEWYLSSPELLDYIREHAEPAPPRVPKKERGIFSLRFTSEEYEEVAALARVWRVPLAVALRRVVREYLDAKGVTK